MKFEIGMSSVSNTQLNGEFQLAELEQRLEMASLSMNTEPVYYCCYCIAFCNANAM